MRIDRRRLVWLLGSIVPWRFALAAEPKLQIRIELPSDRDNTGTLILKNAAGATTAGPFRAYGRADRSAAEQHGNDKRDALLPFGDTPTGTYSIPRAFATGQGTNYPSHSYGPNGALVLRPTGGQALTAAGKGRIGLLIHGGDPGRNGRLRATNGCIRLSDTDMTALMAAVAAAGDNPDSYRCDIVQIDASIGPQGDPVGEDVGDPPPGIEQLLRPGKIKLP